MISFPQSIRELSCLPVSDDINAVALAANTAESIVVPSGARFVIFSGTADFYLRKNATATVAGDTTDGTAAELNPTMRSLSGVTSLSVISESACKVTAAFYS